MHKCVNFLFTYCNCAVNFVFHIVRHHSPNKIRRDIVEWERPSEIRFYPVVIFARNSNGTPKSPYFTPHYSFN